MQEALRLLVVDDDPEFLAYVREGLGSVEAVVAQTPLHALWLLEHAQFGVIVCDLVFGDVDGRHLLELVRERWPETARVLITGFGSRLGGDDDGARELPIAQAIVHKPCDLSTLSAVLADLPASAGGTAAAHAPAP
jgi:CheY-like chemotaxis protein